MLDVTERPSPRINVTSPAGPEVDVRTAADFRRFVARPGATLQ